MSVTNNQPGENDLSQSEPRPMGETLGGYAWLPRMIDKGRAAQAGTLGSMVHPCPVDRVCLARLRLDFDKFTAVIRSTRSDEEVLAGLRGLRIATPAQSWFDPIQREAELEREDEPVPAKVIARADLPGEEDRREFEGLSHGTIGISYVQTALAPGAGCATHSHPYDEVVIVEEGRGLAHVGEDSRDLEAGHTLTIPARTAHGFANNGEDPLRLLELHANGRVIELPV